MRAAVRIRTRNAQAHEHGQQLFIRCLRWRAATGPDVASAATVGNESRAGAPVAVKRIYRAPLPIAHAAPGHGNLALIGSKHGRWFGKTVSLVTFDSESAG